MADLVVKSRCRSMLRQSTDAVLNITFPVWGIVSPVMMICFIINLIAYLQYNKSAKNASEMMAYFSACLCLSLSCLMMKRLVSYDMMIVDKEGIKLPRLIGSKINISTYIPWDNVQKVSAMISENGGSSKLLIQKKKGGSVRVPLNQLPADFIEQFLLAAGIWVPDRCDESLEKLQSVLRIGAQESSQQSYTEIWEEELGRRFCPTSYVPLETGQVLRKSTLRIVNHLSSGGLSALYLCQLDGKQLVALKEAVVPEHSAENVKEKAREMFDREAALLMKLNHSNIVHVLDHFSEGDRNYLMLEYINGTDLRQLVKQNGPQKEADVLEWAVQIALSLKHLHEREQPIIHRDLTPDNLVLRNDGQVIVVDFGAANEFIGTATGTFVGKHAFIAPEQLRGKANIQSDIYAFGCTLYFLLTGEEPEALSVSNPKALAPAVSDELAELIESCTQPEASDRYQSVAQMLPVLRRLVAQSMVA